MRKEKAFLNFIKIIGLIYGLSLAGLTSMIGVDAAQLSFPPQPILLPGYRTYNPDGSVESQWVMSYGGFLYDFTVPTLIAIHDGIWGKNTYFSVPKPFGFDIPLPLMFGSKILGGVHPFMLVAAANSTDPLMSFAMLFNGMISFNITTPNFTNPLIQVVVTPSAIIGGTTIMQYQINTLTFPTIPIMNMTFNITSVSIW